LEIVADHGHDTVGVPAKINRILSIGPLARVELSALNGTGGASGSQFFEVEISSQHLSELNLAAGQPVRLISSQLRVFEQGGRS
jgi:sulfate transport system ATP-binding protein